MALYPTTNINFFDIFGGASNVSISNMYTRSDDPSVPKSGVVGLNNISGKLRLWDPANDFTGAVTYRNYYSSGTTGDNISQPYSFDWGNGGTYLYIVRNSELVRYTCATAYDTTSITTGSKQTYALPTTASTGDTGISYTYFASRGVTVNSAGTKILLSNGDASSGYLVELTMSTAWSLTGATIARDTSQARIGSYWVDANGGATFSNDVTRTGQIQWYDNGNKFSMTGNDNAYVEVRSCPTPYSLSGSSRVSIWNAYYGGSTNNTSSMYISGNSNSIGAYAFSSDGYKLWTMSSAGFQGTTTLFKFDLATAWDPRTAVSRAVKTGFWTTPYLNATDLWVSPDATKLRWVFVQSSSVVNPAIVESNR